MSDDIERVRKLARDKNRCAICFAPAPTAELECPDCRCAFYCSAEHRAEHLAGGHADECEALCAEQLVRWRKAAEGGGAESIAQLGNAYDFGFCRLAKDDAAAASWYTRAADLGHAIAQYNLGIFYRDGMGVEQNLAEALRRFRQAAEQGDAGAQGAIGNASTTAAACPSTLSARRTTSDSPPREATLSPWLV